MSALFLVVAMISDVLPFSQSRLSNQFLTCDDAGELICLRLVHGRGICIVDAFIIPSTCIRGRDKVIAPLVFSSRCIRGRDIVIASLVRVSVSSTTNYY